MDDLSLHILDIAENSVSAGASLIEITVSENKATDILTIIVKDNGRGMPDEILSNVLDPFCTTRTTRNVGLGLPLFAQSARETGGNIEINSEKGVGTTIKAIFKPSSIDIKPLGDLAATFTVLIAGNPDRDFLFSYSKDGRQFDFDTRPLREELEEVPLNSPQVLQSIREFIIESIENVKKR